MTTPFRPSTATSPRALRWLRGACIALGSAVALAATSSAFVETLNVAELIQQALNAKLNRTRSNLPDYKVDADWPRQLPNNWIMGQVGGIAVDRYDRIWVLQRPRSLTVDEAGAAQVPPRSECCFPAPPVLVFDSDGNLINAWGGAAPGYDWPQTEHGIWVDNENNVWIGGNAATDRQVLKFTSSGRFLMQIGHPSTDPIDSTRTDILGQVAQIHVDDRANEVYLADGYGNHRVIVYDSRTGAFKRMWGAYGRPPTDLALGAYDPSQPVATQFRNPVHCVKIADDGLVYVCDRVNNRIQVFTKAGQFVREFFVAPQTRGNGAVWDVEFSNDRNQRYLLVIDGENNVVWTLDRSNGAVLDKQFHAGRNAGQFHWVHQAATDSKGALYTGEVDTAKRVQRFVLDRR
ncbi:hypothetical protein [Piscinibacter koreensis]|uniref:NHL repeat-containing protein n=1 Tax=Piscinibacter koreensis TaxID=2742824 RepID=A0A7Y6NMV1_9BURK|nr:hypothetical protein [Schlegelella koreensis]NUZ06113.1 hypothetical protein [Schlegelella koreensis]